MTDFGLRLGRRRSEDILWINKRRNEALTKEGKGRGQDTAKHKELGNEAEMI